METSGKVFSPLRGGSPPLSPAFRLQHQFLNKSMPRSSPLSRSSGPSEASDLDDLDEQDVWGFDADLEETGADLVKGQATLSQSGNYVFDAGLEETGADLVKGQAPLPPRVSSTGRKVGGSSVTPEKRSPVKNGSLPWAWNAVKGLSSVTGLSPEVNGVGDTTGSLVSIKSTSRLIPTASRMIPRVTAEEKGSLKENFLEGFKQRIPQSAPVNIPAWSKLQSGSRNGKWLPDSDDENDEQEEERIPPHEFLAREYSRSQMTSSSVLEGAGRTLKGRDISRVRDAVLTRTGFLD